MTYTMKTRAGGLYNENPFVPDELIVEVEIGEKRTVASGAGVLSRGAVLGRITASGKYTLSTAAATDGSQTPYGILAEDIDATAADADAEVYLKGTFNSNRLSYGAGQSLPTVYDAFRDVGITLVTAQPY